MQLTQCLQRFFVEMPVWGVPAARRVEQTMLSSCSQFPTVMFISDVRYGALRMARRPSLLTGIDNRVDARGAPTSMSELSPGCEHAILEQARVLNVFAIVFGIPLSVAAIVAHDPPSACEAPKIQEQLRIVECDPAFTGSRRRLPLRA